MANGLMMLFRMTISTTMSTRLRNPGNIIRRPRNTNNGTQEEMLRQVLPADKTIAGMMGGNNQPGNKRGQTSNAVGVTHPDSLHHLRNTEKEVKAIREESEPPKARPGRARSTGTPGHVTKTEEDNIGTEMRMMLPLMWLTFFVCTTSFYYVMPNMFAQNKASPKYFSILRTQNSRLPSVRPSRVGKVVFPATQDHTQTGRQLTQWCAPWPATYGTVPLKQYALPLRRCTMHQQQCRTSDSLPAETWHARHKATGEWSCAWCTTALQRGKCRTLSSHLPTSDTVQKGLPCNEIGLPWTTCCGLCSNCAFNELHLAHARARSNVLHVGGGSLLITALTMVICCDKPKASRTAISPLKSQRSSPTKGPDHPHACITTMAHSNGRPKPRSRQAIVEVQGWSRGKGTAANGHKDAPTNTPRTYPEWSHPWSGSDCDPLPTLLRGPLADDVMHIYTDGGFCKANRPGCNQASWAFVVAGEAPYHGPVCPNSESLVEGEADEDLDNTAAELQALYEALQYALKLLKAGHIPQITSVIITSDSTYALDAVQGVSQPQQHQTLVLKTRKVADEVLRKAELRFQWTAAHNGTAGNELADAAATLSLRGVHRLPPSSTETNLQRPPPLEQTGTSLEDAQDEVSRLSPMSSSILQASEVMESILHHMAVGSTALQAQVTSELEGLDECIQLCNHIRDSSLYQEICTTVAQTGPDDLAPLEAEILYRLIEQGNDMAEQMPLLWQTICRVCADSHMPLSIPRLTQATELCRWYSRETNKEAVVGPSTAAAEKQKDQDEVTSPRRVPQLQQESSPAAAQGPLDETTNRAGTSLDAKRKESPGHHSTGHQPQLGVQQHDMSRPKGPGYHKFKHLLSLPTPPTQMIVINTCAGTGISDLALKTALSQLAADGLQVEVLRAYRYEIDSDARLMSESLMHQEILWSMEERGPMNEASETQTAANASDTVMIVRMSATPCQTLSRGIFHHRHGSRVGPHAPPSNLMWQDVLTSSMIQDCRPDHVSIKEQVIPAIAAWEDMMDMVMGHKNIQDGANHLECATRERLYYTSPQIDHIFQDPPGTRFVLHRRRNLRLFEIHGAQFLWPADKGIQTKPVPTIKAVYPWLLERQSDPQQARPLTGSERYYVQQLRLRSITGPPQYVYAGPHQLAMWLGLTPAQALKACRPFPCQGEVEPVYGLPREEFEEGGSHFHMPKPPEEVYRRCQVQRLCYNCGRAATLLGTAWCLPSAAEIIYKTIATAILAKHKAIVPNHFSFQPMQSCHRCGDQCHLAELREDLDHDTPRHKRRR